MKKLVGIIFLLLSTPVYAQFTQAQIDGIINSQLPTTGAGAITAASLRGVLHNMNAAAFNPGGPIVISPTASTTSKGLWVYQNLGGAVTGFTPANLIQIASDNVTATTTAGEVIGLDIVHSLQGGDQGARTGLNVSLLRAAGSNASNVLYQDTGAFFSFAGSGNNNGTIGSPKGSGYAMATNAALMNNATFWQTIQGSQIGLSVDSTSSSLYEIGLRIGHSAGHATKGSSYDTAVDFVDDAAATAGWDSLITSSNVGGNYPIALTGTFMRTLGAQTFANGIDMSSATITNKLITGPSNSSFITGAYGEFNSAYGLAPSSLQVAQGGKTVNRVTTTNPTVAITRTEALTGGGMSGGQNASLFVETIGYNTATENTSFASYATQFGSGDVTGVIGRADYFGSGVGGAFGGFFWAGANTASSVAIGIEFSILNGTGHDLSWAAYSAAAPGGQVALGLDIPAGGSNLNTAGVSLRQSGALWDVGVGALPGSIKTAFLQDDSSSVTNLKATGAHTNGIDLSAATYTGAAILAPLLTPTSSTATCTAGALKWDANYIYVCVGTNMWKRAAVTSAGF